MRMAPKSRALGRSRAGARGSGSGLMESMLPRVGVSWALSACELNKGMGMSAVDGNMWMWFETLPALFFLLLPLENGHG